MSLVNTATLPAHLAEAQTYEGYSVRKNSLKVTCLEYRPKDFSQAYVLLTCAFTLVDIHQQAGKMAKETIKALKAGQVQLSNQLGLFSSSPMNIANREMKKLHLSVNNIASESEDGKIVQEMGLDLQKLSELTPRIEAIVMEVLRQIGNSGQSYVFKREQTDEDIDTWQLLTEVRCFDAIYDILKFECLGKAKLSKYGIKEEQIFMMSCFGYAIAKIAKEQVQEFLLLEQMKTFSLIDWLLDKGWEHVSSPEPQDLVIYHHHKSKKIDHAGIYLGNGEVESKPGRMNTRIFKHQAMDVLGLYGTSLIFMRKKG